MTPGNRGHLFFTKVPRLLDSSFFEIGGDFYKFAKEKLL